MIARRKGSHAGAGHVKYLHFVVICVTRCIYNKSAKLKRHDRKSFRNLKRKGISGFVGGERFEMPVAAYSYYTRRYTTVCPLGQIQSDSMGFAVERRNRKFRNFPRSLYQLVVRLSRDGTRTDRRKG